MSAISRKWRADTPSRWGKHFNSPNTLPSSFHSIMFLFLISVWVCDRSPADFHLHRTTWTPLGTRALGHKAIGSMMASAKTGVLSAKRREKRYWGGHWHCLCIEIFMDISACCFFLFFSLCSREVTSYCCRAGVLEDFLKDLMNVYLQSTVFNLKSLEDLPDKVKGHWANFFPYKWGYFIFWVEEKEKSFSVALGFILLLCTLQGGEPPAEPSVSSPPSSAATE